MSRTIPAGTAPYPTGPWPRALALWAAVALVGVAGVGSRTGQLADSALMGVGFGHPSWAPLLPALQLLRRASPALVLVLWAVLGAYAVRLGRWRLVLRSILFVGLSAIAALLLKRIVHRPALGDPTYPYNTWPSGHACLTTALLLAAVAVAPAGPVRRGRVWAVVCAGLFLFVASSVATMAHRPSDVVAGVLIAAVAAGPSLAGRDGAARPWAPSGAVPATLLGLAVLATGGYLRTGWPALAVLANTAWLAWAVVSAVGSLSWPRPGPRGRQQDSSDGERGFRTPGFPS